MKKDKTAASKTHQTQKKGPEKEPEPKAGPSTKPDRDPESKDKGRKGTSSKKIVKYDRLLIFLSMKNTRDKNYNPIKEVGKRLNKLKRSLLNFFIMVLDKK